MELEEHFKQLASNIEPAETHRDEAISGHKTLRERLEKDKEVNTVLKETFLSGSYRRHTAVKPIKDVDIFVALSADRGSARKTLEWIEKSLNRVGYKAKTAPQRRSVRVDLSYVTMDVVPALAPNGVDHPLEIPSRHEDKWITSNPKRHIEHTTNLNKRSNGERFVPTVKLAKWWRGYRMANSKHPKGFFLECLCGQHMDLKSSSYANAFSSILESMLNNYGATPNNIPQLPDPGMPGKQIASGITLQEFRTFMREVQQSLGIAQQAIGVGTEKDSVSHWKRVFGPEFPGSWDGGAKVAVVAGGPSVLRRSPRNVKEAPPFA